MTADHGPGAPDPRGDDPVIEFREVSCRSADGRNRVAGLSFAVRRGETLILLGKSGAGKTTALKLINRLLEPTAGEVRVEGRRTADWDPIRLRRRIGYVIQEVGLLPHLTVADNVGLVPRLEGWDRERIRLRVRGLLALVGLDPDEYATRRPASLSGGQRQRVGVARALAADPPVLLMDEPFGALDPVTRAGLQAEFQDLQRRLEKTIVFVTHDVREAILLGTRIGLFADGRLVAVHPAAGFVTAPEPEAAGFIAALRDAGRSMDRPPSPFRETG
jgi:osmoprotectant transport system ATP-binding protein